MTLTDPVLVVADHVGGTLTAPAAELLTLARSLAGEVVAVTLAEPDVAGLGRYGVRRVVVPDLHGLAPEVSAVAAEAVLAAVERVRPAAVLVSSTFAGKELAARLAVALGSGAVVDATGVRADGESLTVDKTVFAGTWATTCTVRRGLPVVAVKPAVVDAEPVEAGGDAVAETVAVEFSAVARSVELVSRTPRPSSGRPPLAEAKTVVVGGRGTDGDFTLVEELADELGGAVGATRVAVDEGWIDHSAQVGQTGTTISPRLYIGAGVSGAIHHTAGMQAAETIVVITDDPDAPIFEMADFGVVGDLNDVLPQAIAELRRLRS